MQRQKEKIKYIGSVRFYKHLFISIFCAVIIIPTVLCITFVVKANSYQNENNALIEKLSERIQPKQTETLVEPVEEDIPLEQESPEYQNMYEDLYVKYPELFIAEEGKTVYLTFDDGPSRVTDDILAILLEKNVKATFFVVGNQLETVEN